MNTYLSSYYRLGQEFTLQHPIESQESLLLHAWGEFWQDVMTETCPPPDSALVLISIRYALHCARIHRASPVRDRESSAMALAQAIAVQTEAVLRWCDDRGLKPPLEMQHLVKTAFTPENQVYVKHSLGEGSIS